MITSLTRRSKGAPGSNVGPFDLANLFGRDALEAVLSDRHNETGEGVFDPAF
jgi:3-hydroxyacyl-CoA dehydrogenase